MGGRIESIHSALYMSTFIAYQSNLGICASIEAVTQQRFGGCYTTTKKSKLRISVKSDREVLASRTGCFPSKHYLG